VLAAALLLALVAPQAAQALAAPASNAGVYALNSVASTQPLPTAAYSSSYIDGVTLVFYWNAVEPQDGVYDWTAVDSQIAAAAALGKKVNLGVLPGVFAPSWLYGEGAAQFQMLWTAAGWGFPLCSMVPLPLPWDPVYQSKWLAFIAQLGQRYAANPSVVMLKIQGVNSSTPELFLPYSRPTGSGVDSTGCQEVDNVAAWLAAGYRPSLIVTAWKTFAKAYATSFPGKYLILESGTWPLPPITNSGSTAPFYGGDYHTPQTLIAVGAAVVGKYFVSQNDQLTAIYNWPRPANLPLTDEFAYQTAWNVDQDPTCRMNGGVQPCDPATVMGETVTRALTAATTYLEVYSTDAQDASEAAALTIAHDALTAAPAP
jgi:hypothetical protein